MHHVWAAPLETLAIIALLLAITIYSGLPALWIVVLALPLQCAWVSYCCCPSAQQVQVLDLWAACLLRPLPACIPAGAPAGQAGLR